MDFSHLTHLFIIFQVYSSCLLLGICLVNNVAGRVEEHQLTAEEGADMLDAYLRIDRDIYKEERNPPVPSLGHAMVKLDRVTSEFDTAMLEMTMDGEDQVHVPGTVPELNSMRLENYDDSLRRILHELGLNRMPDQAVEHEEFVANINRKAMKHHRILWLNQRKEDAQNDVSRLSERVQHIQSLYQHQDALINGMGAPKPELLAEADRLRSYRDTLYSGELAWRDASRLIQASATLSRSGMDSWNQIQDTIRWRLASETRNSMHESVMCIQAAQKMLNGVQFPYCTHRELLSLLQVLEYMFTDMQIPDRYKHATQVYNSFQKRTVALYSWIKKMMDETIHKDVIDVDQKLAQITTTITSQMANNIRQLAGLGQVKTGFDVKTSVAAGNGHLTRQHDFDNSKTFVSNAVVNNNSFFKIRDQIRPAV